MRLDPELGMNPHLCFCPRCGVDSNMLVLMGIRKYKITCRCGTVNYGAVASDKCGRCGDQLYDGKRELVGEHEKLPGDPCQACVKEIEEHRAIVAAGGVYWRCATCSLQGVIRDSEFAKAVRNAHKLPAPALCGVEFTKCDEHKSE